MEPDWARLREEMGIPTAFPPAVGDAVAARLAAGPITSPRRDATDLPFVTIDPPGSRDLDQAFTAQRTEQGYRVWYAIADVAAFVTPGDAIDLECWHRGVTLYLPDGRSPLHPAELSEGAASLLPDQERPALLWTMELAGDGSVNSSHVERALVRSRAALDYPSVQAQLDAGTASPALALLREIGEHRLALERARGGVSLNLPEQEIVEDGHGHVSLAYRATLPVEAWNAQISLMTGMAAAQLMLGAGVGIVRTLPKADDELVARLRHTAQALSVAWPRGATYAQVVSGLDASRPGDAAFLTQAARLLRGAGYQVVGSASHPDELTHGAIGAPYAHVTAPLRRLVDRFANEIVLAICAGHAPASWAVEQLTELVGTMAGADQHAHGVERGAIAAMECALLEGRVGETFPATAVDRRNHSTIVQLHEPAVVATAAGEARLGAPVAVTVEAVDRPRRELMLRLAR